MPISIYSYSGDYLTSISIGNHSSAYNYSTHGDLISIQYASGLRRTWTYDEMYLLSGSTIYNQEDDLLAAIDLTHNWNGRMTMTMQPQNVTTELVYDTLGQVIASLPQNSDSIHFVEMSTVVSDSVIKSYMFGDQVSCKAMYKNGTIYKQMGSYCSPCISNDLNLFCYGRYCLQRQEEGVSLRRLMPMDT